jgi:cell division topological specificity factor
MRRKLNIFKSDKKTSAKIAKDRLLQLCLHSKMANKLNVDNIDELQKALIEVIIQHLRINKNEVSVEVERDDNLSILVNVVLPTNS